MKQAELSMRLWDFAAPVGKVVDALPDSRSGRDVAGQRVRSGTSAPPKYDESGVAESRANRITKQPTMSSILRRLNLAILLAFIVSMQAAEPPPPAPVVRDLTPLHDPARLLVNPHKGWYHHFSDNHPNKYQIARDADLLDFPGMDHLYIRLAWAYLEPKEGQFDWAVIDRIIEKWTAHGLGISFRISCKKTSTDRIEQQFATPRWVMEAGAQGGHYRMGKATGPEGPWEPASTTPFSSIHWSVSSRHSPRATMASRGFAILKFQPNSKRNHDEWLRRARVAVEPTPSVN